MSKGINIDIVPVLNWLVAQNAFKKEEKEEKPRRTEKKEKPPSWEDLWLQEQQRRAKFDDMMKMIKKQLAEEPKKKGWSVDHIALFLLGTMPVNWLVVYLLTR